jgi:tetratricopeptide (TPR) repeat protein
MTPGAVTLWGLIAGLSANFSTYFINALKHISPEISWDDALRALSSRSLVQFSVNGKSLHMLMPVKAQWERLAGKKEKRECYALWAKLIGYVAMQADSCEHTHDARLSNSIRGVVFECMRSFMMITEFLIQDGQIEAAEKCINAMQDYYESLSDSAFEFLKNLPLDKFSLVTKGMIIKCKGDICRLGRKEEPNIAEGYYKEALVCFEKCRENVWLAQVMNVIGKNKFWSFHDAEKALGWLEKSEKLSKDEQYTRGIAEAKKDQAIILTEEYKSYEKAKKYLEDANSMYSELGDYRGIAHTLKRQGVIMEKSGNICKAVKKYEEALEFYECAHYIQGQGDTLSRICNAYIELGEKDKLEKNIVRSEKIMDKIPYQMIKNDLAGSIKKGRNWLQDRE